MFDPHGWSEDSYYEALGKLPHFFVKALWVKPSTHECVCLVFPAKAQKVEMDKLEKAKKERTKVSPTKQKKWSGLYSCQFSVCIRGKSPPVVDHFYFTSSIRHAEIYRAKFSSCNSSGPAPCSPTAQPCPFVSWKIPSSLSLPAIFSFRIYLWNDHSDESSVSVRGLKDHSRFLETCRCS